MASASPSFRRLTEDEYLALDRKNGYKSEFVDGQMRAMAGGTLRHSAISSNCTMYLGEKFAGRGCTVFNSDARLRTPSTGAYVYPDISVVCGPVQTVESAVDIFTNPVLIVEVLSPGTANFDRHGKFALYREIESVKEYLLLHTDTFTVEHYSRQADNSWIYRETKGREAAVSLPALDITLPLEKIYGNSMAVPG